MIKMNSLAIVVTVMIITAISCTSTVFAKDYMIESHIADRIIMSNHDLVNLDAQLGAAYETAVIRSGSNASDLIQDEVNWLGQRDRLIASALKWKNGVPSLDGHFKKSLKSLYESRITFLNNIDNHEASKNRPIAQDLINTIKALPVTDIHPFQTLRKSGVIVIPKAINTTHPINLISRLASQPDAALKKKITSLMDDGLSHSCYVVYLPRQRLGGVYNIEGTGDFQYWVLFRKKGNNTVTVKEDNHFLDRGIRDGGSTGYLAIIHGHPVALAVTKDHLLPITNLQWESWLEDNHWGVPEQIVLRYSYTLKSTPSPYPSYSGFAWKGHRRRTRTIAITAARIYLSNALSLARITTTMDRPAQKQFMFLYMHAPQRKDWGSCWSPVWFPAYLQHHLLLGGVVSSYIGCHPIMGSLDIAYWGHRSHSGQWWSVDHSVWVDPHQLLTVSVMPVAKVPLL